MPVEPVVPHEHAARCDMIQLDTKKLGRIEEIGHRILGDRRDRRDAGWEFLFVAIDAHARLGFTAMYVNERTHNAIQFLRDAARCRHSTQRTAYLDQWIHHDKWHRPHQSIGGVDPLFRLPVDR